jgi:DNA-directed RNA polymerase subunit RPC12/RpoP
MTQGAVDVVAPVAKIVAQIVPIGSIGVAMLLTVVALFAFDKLRGMVALPEPEAAYDPESAEGELDWDRYEDWLVDRMAQNDFWGGGFKAYGWDGVEDGEDGHDVGGVEVICRSCETHFHFPAFDQIDDGQCPDCGQYALYCPEQGDEMGAAMEAAAEIEDADDEEAGAEDEGGYDYVCHACSRLFDVEDAMIDGDYIRCPDCGPDGDVEELRDMLA